MRRAFPQICLLGKVVIRRFYYFNYQTKQQLKVTRTFYGDYYDFLTYLQSLFPKLLIYSFPHKTCFHDKLKGFLIKVKSGNTNPNNKISLVNVYTSLQINSFEAKLKRISLIEVSHYEKVLMISNRLMIRFLKRL
jgi:hypothetical protein